MNIRLVKASDQDQIFERFISVQIGNNDLKSGNLPSSGFFEYDLSYDEIKERAQGPLSLVLENSKGILVGYLLSYPISYIKTNIRSPDAVHKRLEGMAKDSMYLDQLFLERGSPLYLAMRVFDKWDFLAQSERVPPVFTAVPHKPWINIPSHRLATYRGFKRDEFVKDHELSLSLFEKPFY